MLFLFYGCVPLRVFVAFLLHPDVLYLMPSLLSLGVDSDTPVSPVCGRFGVRVHRVSDGQSGGSLLRQPPGIVSFASPVAYLRGDISPDGR